MSNRLDVIPFGATKWDYEPGIISRYLHTKIFPTKNLRQWEHTSDANTFCVPWHWKRVPVYLVTPALGTARCNTGRILQILFEAMTQGLSHLFPVAFSLPARATQWRQFKNREPTDSPRFRLSPESFRFPGISVATLPLTAAPKWQGRHQPKFFIGSY